MKDKQSPAELCRLKKPDCILVYENEYSPSAHSQPPYGYHLIYKVYSGVDNWQVASVDMAYGLEIAEQVASILATVENVPVKVYRKRK